MESAVIADSECYPGTDVEPKLENFGVLRNGRVVALDYGLWDAQAVRERRAYYLSKSS
jgi:isocitrate dehydrogenase kinase/phosphatase